MVAPAIADAPENALAEFRLKFRRCRSRGPSRICGMMMIVSTLVCDVRILQFL